VLKIKYDLFQSLKSSVNLLKDLIKLKELTLDLEELLKHKEEKENE
tara:strand:- start:17001 stop:17138 length:138 start_codon:yes stop_codon:yes gene_type:complete